MVAAAIPSRRQYSGGDTFSPTPGIYFITIRTASSAEVKKLVVE